MSHAGRLSRAGTGPAGSGAAERRGALPPVFPGERIGLYGGSFDPPHHGHLHVAETALKRLGLDRLWWVVTPGNPLKANGAAPLAERLAAVRALARDRRMVATGFEAGLGLTYSFETVSFLRSKVPGVRFVWIMGADNLASFHRWRDWRRLAGLVPMAIVDRPGATRGAFASPAAHALARFRVPERDAASLAGRAPPAWCFLHAPLDSSSSTALRAARLKAARADSPPVP